jgi:hypothetical protein
MSTLTPVLLGLRSEYEVSQATMPAAQEQRLPVVG